MPPDLRVISINMTKVLLTTLKMHTIHGRIAWVVALLVVLMATVFLLSTKHLVKEAKLRMGERK